MKKKSDQPKTGSSKKKKGKQLLSSQSLAPLFALRKSVRSFSFQMADSQLLATRFVELVESGSINEASHFLADDVIATHLNGIYYGKQSVTNYLLDARRYMHHKSNFNRWRQVHHCVDPTLRVYDDGAGKEHESRLSRSASVMTGRSKFGDAQVAQYFDPLGYDSHRYAMFEREGWVGCHPKISFWMIPVRQMVVVRDGEVTVFSITKKFN